MVEVYITMHVQIENNKLERIEELIKSVMLKYNYLNIIGSYISESNEVQIYIVMNTKGSYEENLTKIKKLHFKLERLLEDTEIKYNGISLIPNKIKWN